MAGCTEGCKQEFKGSNFGLNHERPHLFVTSQWTNCRCSPLFYVIFRLLALAGCAVMLALQVVKAWGENGDGFKFFAFLTNLAFMLLTIDVFLQFLFAVVGYSRYRKANGVWEKAYTYQPWYLRLQWAVTNMATCSGFLVTLFFWTVTYNDELIVLDYNVHNMHTVNSAYLILNLFVTAMPVRIYHVIFSYIFVVLYTIVTVLYQEAFNAGLVYNLLDWNKPGLTVGYLFAIGFLGSTGVWLVYYALYRVRLAIFARVTKETEAETAVVRPRDVEPVVMAGSGRTSREDYSHDNPGYVTTIFVE